MKTTLKLQSWIMILLVISVTLHTSIVFGQQPTTETVEFEDYEEFKNALPEGVAEKLLSQFEFDKKLQIGELPIVGRPNALSITGIKQDNKINTISIQFNEAILNPDEVARVKSLRIPDDIKSEIMKFVENPESIFPTGTKSLTLDVNALNTIYKNGGKFSISYKGSGPQSQVHIRDTTIIEMGKENEKTTLTLNGISFLNLNQKGVLTVGVFDREDRLTNAGFTLQTPGGNVDITIPKVYPWRGQPNQAPNAGLAVVEIDSTTGGVLRGQLNSLTKYTFSSSTQPTKLTMHPEIGQSLVFDLSGTPSEDVLNSNNLVYFKEGVFYGKGQLTFDLSVQSHPTLLPDTVISPPLNQLLINGIDGKFRFDSRKFEDMMRKGKRSEDPIFDGTEFSGRLTYSDSKVIYQEGKVKQQVKFTPLYNTPISFPVTISSLDEDNQPLLITLDEEKTSARQLTIGGDSPVPRTISSVHAQEKIRELKDIRDAISASEDEAETLEVALARNRNALRNQDIPDVERSPILQQQEQITEELQRNHDDLSTHKKKARELLKEASLLDAVPTEAWLGLAGIIAAIIATILLVSD